MDAIASLRAEIDRLDAEKKSLQDRIERNDIARHALVDFLRRLTPNGTEKVGPTHAVRQVLARNPGLSRRELLEQAMPLANTAPEKLAKTVRQTILNLIHNGWIVERERRLYPRAEKPVSVLMQLTTGSGSGAGTG